MHMDWCKNPDSGLLKPDVVIFLDIDPSVAQNRGEYGAERYENVAMQNSVRSNFLKLKDDTWKVTTDYKFLYFSLLFRTIVQILQVVDASRSIEEVHNDICKIVQETLDNITPESSLEKLWV